MAGCSATDNIGGDSYMWNVYPSKTNYYDLGSPIYRWNNGNFVNVNLTNINGVPYVPSGGGSVSSVGLSLPSEFTVSL
jgi:hypothetical protein